ncbi:MAG: AAA family ATPase [Bacteroidales bacterium]|nr:AAA family ATPase [Bacteroidales bacterium]
MSVYITDINIESMWGDTTLKWNNLDRNVNIVVGQNGFGKSTMLNLIRAVLTKDEKTVKRLKAKVLIKTNVGEMYCDGKQVIHNPDYGGFESESNFRYVSTFDQPASKKSSLSQLGMDLDAVIYQRSDSIYSFSDYRLGMLKDLKTAMAKQERIEKFFGMINQLFESTEKVISIDDKNRVIFKKGDLIIPLERLSAGEKQILLLLFTLFLMEEKPNVFLLDEPEISLHIEWQDHLIALMNELNPNCQLIMTTHSPNIFADGWEDKLVFISDLIL